MQPLLKIKYYFIGRLKKDTQSLLTVESLRGSINILWYASRNL